MSLIYYTLKMFDDVVLEHNVEKIKTIGDAYMGSLTASGITLKLIHCTGLKALYEACARHHRI